jgi:hypothetical protein
MYKNKNGNNRNKKTKQKKKKTKERKKNKRKKKKQKKRFDIVDYKKRGRYVYVYSKDGNSVNDESIEEIKGLHDENKKKNKCVYISIPSNDNESKKLLDEDKEIKQNHPERLNYIYPKEIDPRGWHIPGGDLKLGESPLKGGGGLCVNCMKKQTLH